MADPTPERFLDDLLHMCGEVPVAAIVAKVRAEIGDDDSQIRQVMGCFAFMAKCAGQSDEPLELRARDAMLDVIITLALGPTREDASPEEKERSDRIRRLFELGDGPDVPPDDRERS